MINKKELAELIWAVVAFTLGFLFAFSQLVPDLGTAVSESTKILFGATVGLCSGATFFLMGVPVIEVVSAAFESKRSEEK